MKVQCKSGTEPKLALEETITTVNQNLQQLTSTFSIAVEKKKREQEEDDSGGHGYGSFDS
jgi:hypothetical protein